MKLFTIPNLFTLGNLLCGCLAIIFALEGNLSWSAYLVGIAAVLDFFDGFVARLLNSSSPIGKELDSLADCVTFGVVPGIMLMQLMNMTLHVEYMNSLESNFSSMHLMIGRPTLYPQSLIALIIPLFSALRLAKFNIDTRQSDSFIGVPTPANAMLISAICLMLNPNAIMLGNNGNPFTSDSGWMMYPPFSRQINEIPPLNNFWFLAGLAIVMSLLLISELPLFALKFKKFGWKGNEVRYGFLLACLAMIVLLGYAGIALSIVAYILLSVVLWLINRGKQSAG